MRGKYKLPDGMISMTDGTRLSVEDYIAGGYRPDVKQLKSESKFNAKHAAKPDNAVDAEAGSDLEPADEAAPAEEFSHSDEFRPGY